MSGRSASYPTSRRILVVDDYVDVADALAEAITMLGRNVDVAYDGETALSLFDDHHHDLVLCDLALPGMDGFEIACEIRRRSGPDTRLIALSGRTRASDVKQALAAGFDEHLAKPVEFASLERLLQAF